MSAKAAPSRRVRTPSNPFDATACKRCGLIDADLNPWGTCIDAKVCETRSKNHPRVRKAK